MTNVTIDGDALVTSEPAPGFSWRAVFAGALVASGVIFFLLSLGAGIGLSLFTAPDVTAESVHAGVTLGAIYFFVSQAFGLAVGGYVAGRLMGPVLESREEEIFHASTHGLVTWALGVVITAVLATTLGIVGVTGAGASGAAIVGGGMTAPAKTADAAEMNGYWVDLLFRPNLAQPAATPPVDAQASGAPAVAMPNPPDTQARAEASRILTVGLLNGRQLSAPDHDRLAALISQSTGADTVEANRRVDDAQIHITQQAAAAAEAARRFARFLSLWLAASLIFGALAASGAAVTGRWIDDEARTAED